MPEMIVRIGADVQPAIAGITVVGSKLDSLSQKVQRFGGGVRSFISPVVTEFGRLPAPINKAGEALTKLPNASNAATQSLVNLSRVAQDAPFGFLGIANNINPLLESFQRLRATSGSTGGALKALGSSLLGAGGLGLAVGIGSSLLTVFGDKLFGAGQAAKKAKEDVDEYKNAVKGIFDEAGKEAAQVQSLIVVLNSETETRQRKLAAIKELQAIQPEIFGNLKLEGNAVAGLDAAYKNYVANLRTVIAAKLLQAKVEQLITRQLELQGATATGLVKGFKDAQAAIDSATKLGGKKEIGGGLTPEQGANVLKPFEQGLLNQKKKTDKELDGIQNEINQALAELSKISTGITVPIDKVTADKTSKPEIDFTPIGKQLQRPISVPFSFIVALADIKTVLLGGDLKGLQEQAQDSINKGIEKLAVSIRPPQVKLNKPTDEQLKVEAFTAGIEDAINRGIQSIQVEGLSGIGEAIGEALAGGDIQDAFRAFGNTIGGALQAIGKQIISIGVAALLAKKALEKLFANPAIAIAAGVALVAAGAALKNVVSGGIKARKKGGPVKPGEPYLVGEEGPEIVTFQRNGVVIPANKTKDILQGKETANNVGGILTSTVNNSKNLSETVNNTSFSPVSNFLNTTFSAIKELPRREFGGPVVSDLRYIVGEKGRELYVPFSTSTISRNKPTGLSGAALSSSGSTQYIPMIRNGELGLLIKRNEKYLGRNT